MHLWVTRPIEDAAGLAADARSGVGRVLSEDNIASMNRTVGNLEEASTGALSLVGPERQASVDTILASTENASRELELLIAEVRDQARGILGDTPTTKTNQEIGLKERRLSVLPATLGGTHPT